MKTIELELPDTLELEAGELQMIIATKLYEKGKLSIGQAAELAGFSVRSFIEIISAAGISVINHNPSELYDDFNNAKSYNI